MIRGVQGGGESEGDFQGNSHIKKTEVLVGNFEKNPWGSKYWPKYLYLGDWTDKRLVQFQLFLKNSLVQIHSKLTPEPYDYCANCISLGPIHAI